ncbi:MAG: hypothetical protein RL693_905 [Verrucomicrobiota bacterium]|jgi:hypothetical protein
MNTSETTKAFIHAARDCAMQLMQNATYIEKNLPTIEVPDGAAERIRSMCQSLIGTKQDVMTELFELNEKAEVPSDLSPGVDRIEKWLSEAMAEMHEEVEAMRVAKERDDRFSLGFILLAESGVNLLNAFNAVWDAAVELQVRILPPAM